MTKQNRWYSLTLSRFGALAKVGGTSAVFAGAYIAADTFTLGTVSGVVALTGLAAIWSDRKADKAGDEEFREFRTELLNEVREIRSLVEYVLVVTVSYSAASFFRTILEGVNIYWLTPVMCIVTLVALYIFWPRVKSRYVKQ